MNRHPEYKDSGIEWIGEIPRSWAVGRLKWQIVANDGGIWGDSPQNDDSGTIVIRSTEITISGSWDMSNPMLRLLSSEERKKFQLKEGDIVITKSSGSPKHIGKSAVVNRDIEEQICCFSNFVQRIRFKSFSPSLYHYLLNSYLVREQYRFLTRSTTGLGNLDSFSIGEILLPYIPLQHQSFVLHYLDRKTTQIDSLIEKFENKIELLKEYRVALISQSVTKGLNSDVEMKDSGIEWIGEIPKDWEITRIKNISDSNTTALSDATDPEYKFIYIEIGDVDHINGIVINDPITFSESPSRARRVVNPGDVIVSTVRTYLKAIGTIPEINDVICSTGFCVLTGKDGRVNQKFLAYSALSDWFISFVISNSDGVSYPAINSSRLIELPIAMPSLTEQKVIVQYLNKSIVQIDSLIEKLEKKIEYLNEYRQSLISNVLTGKIRVSEQIA